MSAEMPSSVCYRINQIWTLDTVQNRLISNNSNIELEYRLVILLCYMINRPHQILSKGQLLHDNWPDRVVNEENLTVAISKLRKAFSDSSKAPTLIKTIPGVGYQFIAEAEALSPTEVTTPVINGVPALRLRLSILLLAMILLSGVGFYNWQKLPPALAQQVNEDTADSKQQIAKLREQLQRKPDHADSYWQLAWLKMTLLGDKLPQAHEHFAELSALLQKTLTLETNHAAAAMWLGRLYFWHQQDYQQAEHYFLQALTIQTNAEVLYAYAEMLLAMGRFDDCFASVTAARKLDPLTFSTPQLAWFYQLQGKTELAWQELQRISSTDLQTRQWHQSAQRVTFELGMQQQSYTHLRYLLQQNAEGQALTPQTDIIFSQDGMQSVYRYLLHQRFAGDIGHYTPPLSWARYALLAGDNEAAALHFEQAARQKQWPLLWAGVEVLYQPLHSSSVYQQWLTDIKVTHLLPVQLQN